MGRERSALCGDLIWTSHLRPIRNSGASAFAPLLKCCRHLRRRSLVGKNGSRLSNWLGVSSDGVRNKKSILRAVRGRWCGPKRKEHAGDFANPPVRLQKGYGITSSARLANSEAPSCSCSFVKYIPKHEIDRVFGNLLKLCLVTEGALQHGQSAGDGDDV